MKATRTVCHILICAILPVGCGIGEKEAASGVWAGTVENANGVVVVRNPATPLLGELVLDMEEDLILGDTASEASLFFNLIRIGVDGSGNLFVLDPNSFRIQVFGPDGRFLRTVGREGEGPGEFSNGFRMWFQVREQGEIVVLERAQFQFFGPSGEYERSVLARPSSTRFAVLGGGWIVRDDLSYLPGGPTEDVILTDESGQPLGTLASFPSEKWKAAMIDRLRFTHLAPELVLAPWGSGGAAFGFPSKYRIWLVREDGQIDRVIEMAEPPLEVDAELAEALIKDMSSDAPRMSPRDLEGKVYIPETWPFFDALHSDEQGNLFVQRSDPLPPAGAERRLDFYDGEGLYLFQLRVRVDGIQAIRNGYLYAHRYNREIYVDQLVRYRVLNWSRITAAAAEYDLESYSTSHSRVIE